MKMMVILVIMMFTPIVEGQSGLRTEKDVQTERTQGIFDRSKSNKQRSKSKKASGFTSSNEKSKKEGGKDSPALIIAQACVAEISFGGGGVGECTDMWSVNLRAVGGDLDRMPGQAIKYNTLMRRKRGNRAWVLELDIDGNEPKGWELSERGALWSNFRELWLKILVAANNWLKQPLITCSADKYGGDCNSGKDACDPVPAHWISVSCGSDNAQAYWVVGKKVLSAKEAR